ncbi:MAG: hypothetical protein K2M19_00620 [Muribaculaceae bacterium]|nr:hypothetical protein [Muribaculaceae bacterium]
MQKSLLILGMAMGLMSIPVTASAASHPASKAHKVLAQASRKAAAMSPDVVARFYHPQTVTEEYFSSETNGWMQSDLSKFTYNERGQILTVVRSEYKTVYTYNGDGNLIKQEDFYIVDGNEKLTSSHEYTYDTVVKNMVVKATDTSYDPYTGELYGSWVSGADIIRNSDGNITEIKEYSEWDGQKNYEYSMVIEYGSDKKAVKITEYDDGEVECTLSDIVWDTTDGQIVTYEFDDPNSDMYFSNNRIASATILDNDSDWPGAAKFTATYDGDSYHSKVMIGNDLALEIDFKCLGKNETGEDFDYMYSYDCESFESSYEFDEDTNKYFIEYTRRRTEQNRVDAFGLQLMNKMETTYKYANPEYEDETDRDEYKNEVTYDDTFGYPLTSVSYRLYNDALDFEPSRRVTYADYVNVDPAGVASAAVDEAAEAEYFTLQGVRVVAPAEGLYIVRRGAKVTKEIIR